MKGLRCLSAWLACSIVVVLWSVHRATPLASYISTMLMQCVCMTVPHAKEIFEASGFICGLCVSATLCWRKSCQRPSVNGHPSSLIVITKCVIRRASNNRFCAS